MTDGEIHPFDLHEISLRLRVHLALRLIGEKPRELPCNGFRVVRKGEFEERLVLPPLPAPRSERAYLLRTGMKPIEVLRAVGAPDYIPGPYWEYDIDDRKPCTLKIRFKEPWSLEKIERIEPALWRRPGSRWYNENF